MPYRVLSVTDVCRIGSTEAGDAELVDAQAIEAGLNHLEKQGWLLTQVIPERKDYSRGWKDFEVLEVKLVLHNGNPFAQA